MSPLLLLLAFFRLGIDDPKDDPKDDPAADPADPAADPDPDLEADPADPDPDPDQVASKEELETARREANDAKDASERYQRELNQLRQSRGQPRQDDETAREDAILKDPNASPQDKWKVEADRVLRRNTQTAQMTLAEAADIRDQTQFSQLAVTEPAMHKRYAPKVEQELVTARQQGYNIKREFIYNQLIAKDMREGKFKRKAAPAVDSDTNKNKVARGKLPGARSDVSAKSGASEKDKRRARLENVQI